jgi:hypothetical protein
MTAQGTEIVPWAENTPKSMEGTALHQAKPRLFSAAKIKALFGQLAEAVTGKPTPALAAKRKRRREETRGGFMALARSVTNKIRRSIFDFMYAPSAHDPEQERAHAEHVSRMQAEEWMQDDAQEQAQAFHYGSGTHFDPHP